MPEANSALIVRKKGRPKGARNKSTKPEKVFCKKLPQENDQS